MKSNKITKRESCPCYEDDHRGFVATTGCQDYLSRDEICCSSSKNILPVFLEFGLSPSLFSRLLKKEEGYRATRCYKKKKKVIFRERKSEDRWKNYCNYRARLCTGLRLIFSTFVQRIDRSFESRLTRVKLWYSFFHTNLAFSPSFFLFLGKIDLCIHIYRFN